MFTKQLRQTFLNYFRENKHKYAKQSPIVINDPTLLFVNAGMNQFKNIFTGKEEIDSNYTQMMNSQICVRTGGKHNDLDDVGKDSYHLTSFEMLGNWSMNDYWKEESIKLALNFLVSVCGLNKDNIYVTYFEGTDDIPCDNESKEIWSKYIDIDKIVPGSFKDNFWMMGEEGPCGVCTEIHYDLIGGRLSSNLVNKDDPTVIEIWNIVFMEFNKCNGKYELLKKRFVDTGMGLERLSMVMENKTSLYQTSAFRYLMGYAQALTGSEYFHDTYEQNNNLMIDTTYRIFADHIRTVTICLYQRVKFDCNKQGFVLRKIFRRMLTNIYVHLTKNISPVLNNPLVIEMIKNILSYYLINNYESGVEPIDIWKMMVEEEDYFVNKISSLKKKYDSIRKKNSHDDTLIILKTSHGYDLEIINIIISNN